MSFRVDIQPSGQHFEVSGETSILDAALNEGLILKHSCREGTCGSCKGKVVSGEVNHGDSDEALLTADEREDGYALFCCARAASDLVIEAPEVTEVRGISVQQTAARVKSIDKVSDDVVILRIMLPPGLSFNYLPGQYAQVILQDGQRRSYSMATPRAIDNQLEWHIRLVPGGCFTRHVFTDLKPREILRLEGPFGGFFLRESDRPIIFLASGTGFAPIQALIKQLREKDGNPRQVYLYWGGRTRPDLYRHDWLLAQQRELSWLHYTPVLSEPTESCDWRGAEGFVHRRVLEDFPDLSGFEVYACGAPVVVESARRDYVAECGLDPNHFFADAFV